MSCSNRLKLSWAFFDVFIESLGQFYIDFKASDSKNSNYFCFSERGQAFRSRFELFTMPSTFILYTSTIDIRDV